MGWLVGWVGWVGQQAAAHISGTGNWPRRRRERCRALAESTWLCAISSGVCGRGSGSSGASMARLPSGMKPAGRMAACIAQRRCVEMESFRKPSRSVVYV